MPEMTGSFQISLMSPKLQHNHTADSEYIVFNIEGAEDVKVFYGDASFPDYTLEGELIPFQPFDACSPLELGKNSFYNENTNRMQFKTTHELTPVIALVYRGGCGFHDKFRYVQ